MSKIHVRLPMYLYNQLFIHSVEIGKTMTDIIIESLKNTLPERHKLRAGNDNRNTEDE